ncbi:hypothetical protein [Rhodococcus sp. ZPP]|uniref:hypothetical protein n=1 Tax=Rhodococcus sp. ZPP TaxID=2749906 RepID=UPI001FCACD04|nr:hypothetical protein [Rhodococcus sp. ZPP]
MTTRPEAVVHRDTGNPASVEREVPSDTPTAPDPDLRVVIGLAINDRGIPERWTRRITITHDRSGDERRRWTQHLHRAVTERRDWTLTVTSGGPPNPPTPHSSNTPGR